MFSSICGCRRNASSSSQNLRDFPNIPQPLHLPLAVEAGEAGLAGEELLHGGLFEVALLGDELVHLGEQGINIRQGGGDGALLSLGRKWDLMLL